MQEYLIVLKATRPEMTVEGPTEAEGIAIEDHVDYLIQLADDGVLFQAGHTLDSGEDTLGLVIIRAETDEDALAIMQADPAVSAEVLSGRLYQYNLAVTGSGWQAAR